MWAHSVHVDLHYLQECRTWLKSIPKLFAEFTKLWKRVFPTLSKQLLSVVTTSLGTSIEQTSSKLTVNDIKTMKSEYA